MANQRKIVGVSLPVPQLKQLDSLAKREGTSRSQMVGLLVERASVANGGTPDVKIDGRRFVPERRR